MDNLKDKKVTVYGLITDLDENIRYVGQTTKGVVKRLRVHLSTAKRSNNKKANWLKKRIKQGVDIKIVLLDEDAVWDTTETYWIKKLKDGGCNLTNATEGGDGTPGYKHTEETIRHLSKKYTFKDGRVMTITDMAKISELSSEAIGGRLKKGYTPEEAIHPTPKNVNILNYKGIDYTIKEAENKFKIPDYLIRQRLNSRLSHADVLDKPYNKYNKLYLVGTGDWLTVKEITELTGLRTYTVRARITKGFSPEDIIRPLRGPSTVNVYGRQVTAQDIADETGINVGTILSRMQRNVTTEELLSPVQEKK